MDEEKNNEDAVEDEKKLDDGNTKDRQTFIKLPNSLPELEIWNLDVQLLKIGCLRI